MSQKIHGDLEVTGALKACQVKANYPGGNPEGVVRVVSTKLTNPLLIVKHDGADAANGVCYWTAMIGGPVYTAYGLGYAMILSVPCHPFVDGFPKEYFIWASQAATLRVGNISSLDCYGEGIIELDVSGLSALESLNAGGNHFATVDLSGLSGLQYLNLFGIPELTSITGAASLTNLENENFSTAAVNIGSTGLDASAIDAFFTDLPTTTTGVIIKVTGAAGAATCNPAIATAKGYGIQN